ncbi:hypothetical protein HUJ05_002346 [Dendroctonus ponderosae]|nr:hypothetical protein HUJ05_002346 [Dendroctonus ponderosae]
MEPNSKSESKGHAVRFKRKSNCINAQLTTDRRSTSTLENQLDKYCILMFDEISIQAHLKPNYASGSVDGFEDFGFKKIGKIANHVQILWEY